MTAPDEILIVDDELIVLKLLTDILSAEGFQVRSTDTGEMAVRSVASKPPHLILLDIMMPGMDGFEVCRRLKAQKASRHIPVIFISVITDLDEQVRGFGVGAVDFISKPFRREEFLARVRTHLELSRLRTRLEAQVAERMSQLRKSTEETLRERNFSHALLDSLPGIFCLFTQTGKFLRWNNNFEPITEYSSEEIERMSPLDLFVGPDQALIQNLIQETFIKGVSHAEAELITKSGKRLPYYLTGHRIQIEGKPCLIGMGIDIADRKQADEALRKSEGKYRSILETIEDGYYEVDLAGNLTFFNEALTRIHGYSREELMGKNKRQYTDEKNAREMYRNFNQVYHTGQPSKGTHYEIITKNGERKALETSISLIRDPSGQPVGFRGIARDITELRRAQIALADSEERFRSVAESTSDFIFEWNLKSGQMEWFGQALEKLKDLLSEIPQTITAYQKMVHPEDLDRLIAATQQNLEKQGPFLEEYRIIGKGGQTIYLRSAGTCLRNEKGKPYKWIGALSDITERKKREEELRQSVDKLRKMMGGIIQAMALTVEIRDPYTAGHQRRVADLARSISQEMGLTKDQIEAVRLAGTVHDLGKISVPAEILSKPGKLSPLEFNLIKVHPRAGYDILKDIEFPWPIARIVLEHHERINGSGYPQGLKGEEILLESRILAVADVVEAIASNRPYRPAFGIEVALEEISQNKGVLYDPEVVDACLRLFREKGLSWSKNVPSMLSFYP